MNDKKKSKQKGKQKRQIKVDYQYIDLTTCNRCLGTDSALYEAIRDTGQILETSGIQLTLTKTLIETEEQAAELGFLSSPTICINGRDIYPDIEESTCESSCGVVEEGGVDCREWKYQGKVYNTAPKGLIVDAILGEVYGGQEPVAEGSNRIPIEKVPANLKKWFAAKRAGGQQQAEASASGTSCCGPAPAEAEGSCCGPAPAEAEGSCCGPAPAEAEGSCCGPAPAQTEGSCCGPATAEQEAAPLERVEGAVHTFQTAFPCGQAMLSNFSEDFGLDSEFALKVAAPFVGGMGMRGEACGAVTGAFMILGLKYGGIKERGKLVSEMQKLVGEFVEKFEARNGSVYCEKLLGANIGTPEGMKIIQEKGLLSKLCPNLIRDAAEITEELLNESDQEQQQAAESSTCACGPDCCT